MLEPTKKKTLAQLNRAKGMLEKVVLMVEEDKYCIDIIQQSLAVLGFVKSANKVILENHLRVCFKKAAVSGNKKDMETKVEEVMHIMNKCS
jgi:CsoR family transcriptional regulator, copper-sensing transcriptional repressor